MKVPKPKIPSSMSSFPLTLCLLLGVTTEEEGASGKNFCLDQGMWGRRCGWASGFSSFFTSRKIEKICADCRDTNRHLRCYPSINSNIKQCSFRVLYYSAWCNTFLLLPEFWKCKIDFHLFVNWCIIDFPILVKWCKIDFRFFEMVQNRFFDFSKMTQNRFSIIPNSAESILWLLKVGENRFCCF